MPQCHAKSHRSGVQCRKHAINGASVCRTHGGAAPQVKRKAQERLAILVDPAIEEMGKLLNSENPAVVLATVKDILDRNGLKPIKQIEQTNYDVNDVQFLECLTDEELDDLIRIQRKIAEYASTVPVEPVTTQEDA